MRNDFATALTIAIALTLTYGPADALALLPLAAVGLFCIFDA
jgi:hypothetical protein